MEHKYKALVQGKTILESSLHINLAEHLNSEIGLGTITDIDSAKSWLRSSFLYQRMKKNPNYYSLGTKDNQTYEECIDEVVMDSVTKLKKTELIEHVEIGKDSGTLTSTQYGEIMSKVRPHLCKWVLVDCPMQYYIRKATVSVSPGEDSS